MNRERQKEGGRKHTSLSNLAPILPQLAPDNLLRICSHVLHQGVTRGVWRGPVEQGREANLTGEPRLRRALARRLPQLAPDNLLRIGSHLHHQRGAESD